MDPVLEQLKNGVRRFRSETYAATVRFLRVGSLSAAALVLFLCAPSQAGRAAAQTPAPPSATDNTALLAQLTTLRDAFIARVRAAGYSCPLAAPQIAIEHVPSLGNYRSADNVLRTAGWALLSPSELALRARIAGPNATQPAIRQFFETSAHHWIFIHEMGHWFQTCVGAPDSSHFRREFDANRISLAYWRETDPSVVSTMLPVFQSVIDHAPSPLPTGAELETYFDRNYDTLGPSPVYPWFMSRMIVTASAVKPAPSLAEVLASSAK